MGSFLRWEDDSARKHLTTTPIGHFKFYYKSSIDNIPEEPILLDVLYAETPYPEVREYPVKHEWLLTEGEEVRVLVPRIESIIGDKLTAFAPKTTGILYTKGRPVEIVKQLFDLAFLYDLASDSDRIRESYMRIVAGEIKYRNLDITYHDVLKDTRDACTLLALRDNNEHFVQLQTGITNMTNFVIGQFRIEQAITAGAKVAHLTTLVEPAVGNNLERYSGPAQVADLQIKSTAFNRLNKLKKTNPEAFFYWHKALQNIED